MEREVGGGIGMGNTCKPIAVSFQCMTKFTTNKKKKDLLQVELRLFISRAQNREIILHYPSWKVESES